MNREVKKAIKKHFTPPDSQEKEHFIQNLPFPKVSYSRVLINQINFISESTWISFITILILGFFYTTFLGRKQNIVANLSAILPLLALSTILELYRSIACNMDEMELVCKYNLAQITLMRIIILGTVTFLILFLFILFTNKTNFSIFRRLIYISTPYLLSSYLSLLSISKLRSHGVMYICASICLSISIIIVIINYNYSYNFIYDSKYIIFWFIVLIGLLVLISYTIYKITKLQEALEWNSI